MTHLTLTGPYAGRPLCDCDKEQAYAKGDTFQHYQLAPDSVIQSPDTCPVCRVTVETIYHDDATAERNIAAVRRQMEADARKAAGELALDL